MTVQDTRKPLEVALQQLLDEREIERGLLRYARGVDRCDEELIASAYHEDSYDEHGAFHGTGSEFAAWVVELLKKAFVSTTHRISNVTIKFEGDLAKVESYVVAYHKTKGETPDLIIVGARYLDDFSRRGGDWRIARRIVVVDWSQVMPVAAGFPEADYILGKRAPEDPSYGSLFLRDEAT
jgi:hypothetical protein